MTVFHVILDKYANSVKGNPVLRAMVTKLLCQDIKVFEPTVEGLMTSKCTALEFLDFRCIEVTLIADCRVTVA